MSSPTVIHETILRDIIDILHDAKDMDTIKGYLGKKNGIRSINRSVDNLILTFPFIATRAANIKNAAMTSKAVERKVTGILRLLFGAMMIQKTSDIDEIIGQFHSNLKMDDNITVDGILDTVDKYVVQSESTTYHSSNTILSVTEQQILKNDMRNTDYYLEANISDKSVLDYTIMRENRFTTGPSNVLAEAISFSANGKGGINARSDNAFRNKMNHGISSMSSEEVNAWAGVHNRPATGPEMVANIRFDNKPVTVDNAVSAKDPVADINAQYPEDSNSAKNQATAKNAKAFREKNTPGASSNQTSHSGPSTVLPDENAGKYMANNANYFKNQMLESDVKKANELVSTMMTVNVYVKDSAGKSIPVTFIIGIKAKMHTIDSMDIINRLVSKNKDTNTMQQLIRASTREISVFKDFIFAIDKAKVDALSQSRKGSSSNFWKILERRAKKGQVRRAFGMKNGAMAITSIAITQEEADYIKKEHNINVEDVATIVPIMEAYGLLSFIIIDESNEVAKFIFDGDRVYEYVSFNNLERESSDMSAKSVINLMTKMSK